MRTDDIKEAYFRERPNRFVVECTVGNKKVRASLPNPGRLIELFYPGARLLLTKSTSQTAKLPYRVMAVFRDGIPILLDTLITNRVVESYLVNRVVPGLEKFEFVRREIPHGNSRFDFLLKRGSVELYLEVKSCTLFGGTLAMFPDAVTERGKRHLQELAALRSNNRRGMVIFLVQWDRAQYFLPDYHTDPEFSQTLFSIKDKVAILPLATSWSKDLTYSSQPQVLKIPWQVYRREAKDCGAYLILLHCEDDKSITVGKLGRIDVKKGYYFYVGSALKNLKARIQRHKRKRKNRHWHIDYLVEHTRCVQDFPIRTADAIECDLSESISKIADWRIEKFGCSDCKCASHLYGFAVDPRLLPAFQKVLIYYRMERVVLGM